MAEGGQPLRRRDLILAFAPYVIIIAALGITSLHGISTQLEKATNVFKWPGLHVLNAKGKVPTSETFKLTWLTAAEPYASAPTSAWKVSSREPSG